jgi:hypothetical protein
MSILFHETLFDPELVATETGTRFPISGSPTFANTDLPNALTGAHKVNVNRSYALRMITLQVKLADAQDSAYFQNFFMGGFASGIGFRLRYVPDYIATAEAFGTSDGVAVNFYLKKTFLRPQITSHQSVWRITKPVVQVAKETNSFQLLNPNGSNRTPTTSLKIYRNGVEITTGWTVDCKTGVVHFTVAPAAGTLTWTGEFDIPVAFIGNAYEHQFDTPSELTGIQLREIPPVELGILT